MTDLRDRLDALADQAAGGLDLLPPEAAVRARHRHRARLKLSALGVALIAATGSFIGVTVGSSQHRTLVNVGTAPPTPPQQEQLAPLPDTTLTPPGWSPVAYGSVQISVPSSWAVGAAGELCGSYLPGMVLVPGQNAQTEFRPNCGLARNFVYIFPASTEVVPHASSTVLNTIRVTSGWSQAGSLRTERLRALGYDISATGPLADQVLHTLTYSPLSVVLNSHVSDIPAGWQPITFAGMRFSVPDNWAVSRTSSWGGCGYNLPANTLQLSTAETIFAPSCPAPNPAAQYAAGVPAMLVAAGPQIRTIEPGATCHDRNGLRICIDPSSTARGYGNALSILTAQVSVPGQPNLAQVEIGLSGDGTTALHIFDSLHPSDSSTGTSIQTVSGPPVGYYVDGPTGTPHYVLNVTNSTISGFSGWMFFVYQDGNISETFHFHSTAATPDLLLAIAMVTDSTTQPFMYSHVPAGSLPGSQPVPPGRAFSGTYGTIGTTALRLDECGTYLYWANPANISKPMSCSFTYNGTNTW